MFEPLDLGPDIGKLPNRVVMGSMHTGLEGHSIPKLLLSAMTMTGHHHPAEQQRGERGGGGEDDGRDLAEMARYFEERARGGVGLMGE
jgi:2,4-dienoyl-CoA reductase (NADPH2)